MKIDILLQNRLYNNGKLNNKSGQIMNRSLSIEQFIHWGVLTCRPSDSVRSVAELMLREKIGSIFVEDQGKIVGVWTQSDIKNLSVQQLENLSSPIHELMSSPVISVVQDDLVSSATYLFKKYQIHHLLVTDRSGAPVGVLSETDVILSQATENYLAKVTVKEIVPYECHKVDYETPISEALSLFKWAKTDALVVEDSKRKQYGIVSNRDLLSYLGRLDGRHFERVIGEIASWPLHSFSQNGSLMAARQLMIDNRFHHIGIQSDSGELVGILNFSHLVHAIEEFFYHDIEREIRQQNLVLDETRSLYQSIVEATTTLILIHKNGLAVYANPAALELFEYQPDEVKGRSIMDFIAPEFRPVVLKRLREQVTTDSQPKLDELLVTKSGKRFWGEVSTRSIQFEGEEATLVIAHNINHLKQQAEQQRLIQTVFENMDEAILVTDHYNQIIMLNKAFEDSSGYAESELLGLNPSVLKSNHQTTDFYHQLWKKLNNLGYWQGEIWNRKKNGEVFPQWLSISAIQDEEGRVSNYVGIFRDLTGQKRAEEEINRLSFYDLLTSLPNLSLFKDRVKHAIYRYRDNRDYRCAILFLDLARFKRVNDAIGHEQGDQLLVAVGNRLQSAVGAEDTVARMGADTFLILLEDIRSESEAAEFANGIIEQFQAPFVIGEHQHVLDIKIGISLYPTDGQDEATLITAADEAVYQAKELPNSGYVFHTQELAASSFEHFFFEKGLINALERDEFVVYFQPQINLQSNEILGVESLVRWQHPDLGLVSPDKFISIAEETGLIVPLGEKVLQKSCEQWLAWKQKGLLLKRISVNVSAIQLADSEFVLKVQRLLKEMNIPPNVLEFEVTESFLFKNEVQGIDALKGLQALGCSISMDDFGTGFSSLSYLKKLPLNQLKIDQSFIRSLPTDLEDMAIVDSVIAVSHALKLEVVAEGVESLDQASLLLEKGCDIAQGFVYARPMSANEFEDWLARR